MSKTRRVISLSIWILFISLIMYWAMVPNGGAFLSIGKEKPWMFRHFITFLVFVLLTKFSFPKLNYLSLISISFAFGLLIEIFQELFTHGVREFHLANLVLDLVGIAAGIALLVIYKQLRKRTKS